MSINDPKQQQMIQDAMKAIAERKPGRTKLVYDKTKRTIVAVAEGAQVLRALNITADDADMFAVVTLSSRWLREQWPKITRDRMVSALFSSWDEGDAFTQCGLGTQPSPSVIQGAVLLDDGKVPPDGTQLRILLTPVEFSSPDPSMFAAPDGSTHRAVAWRTFNKNKEGVNRSIR